jgi:hypothetical protein
MKSSQEHFRNKVFLHYLHDSAVSKSDIISSDTKRGSED